MAGEVIVDALPYIDQGYDEPGIREAVMAMVEEETRRYRPTKNYLEHLPQLSFHQFETEILKTEYERLQARQPMEMMSMKRYELPQPPAGKTTDVASWNECVDNSYAQLEHQSTRIANLELMSKYGCEAWKHYNAALVQMLHQMQKQLQDLRKQIQEVNWRRKTSQTEGGEKLKNLEANWVGLVSKNYEIERACVELEKEIASLEAEYDQTKKAQLEAPQETPGEEEQESEVVVVQEPQMQEEDVVEQMEQGEQQDEEESTTPPEREEEERIDPAEEQDEMPQASES
ncbi:pre-mRNA-splicing factor SPF27-like [Ornithodoros turicata]|uniref:pre-mRNA-splicing factor SPF27-like n=1 Tax=Ornithodoros turicata TaxID=34597 RepID=UPI0031389020